MTDLKKYFREWKEHPLRSRKVRIPDVGWIVLGTPDEPIPMMRPPPPYILTQQEGLKYADQLKTLINGTEEIGFDHGSLSGPDLKFQINVEKSPSCGLVFVMNPDR